ncbi:unnamed protein product [Rhizophagus irregularis]|nr:unnamed protein product [Rhizophagus irregularis]
MSLLDDDIRVVVSIDFGTTYSGYAYAHKSNPNEIIVQENWEGLEGHYKTPTVIKYDENCVSEWQNLDFYRQVLTILTVPAEFDDDAISTMRECAFNARLTKDKFSRNLKFTTEPEAAAIYCLNSMKGQYNLSTGASFMIVDCGGGTVDLTTRQLLDDNKMSEVTERQQADFKSYDIDLDDYKLIKQKNYSIDKRTTRKEE